MPINSAFGINNMEVESPLSSTETNEVRDELFLPPDNKDDAMDELSSTAGSKLSESSSVKINNIDLKYHENYFCLTDENTLSYKITIVKNNDDDDEVTSLPDELLEYFEKNFITNNALLYLNDNYNNDLLFTNNKFLEEIKKIYIYPLLDIITTQDLEKIKEIYSLEVSRKFIMRLNYYWRVNDNTHQNNVNDELFYKNSIKNIITELIKMLKLKYYDIISNYNEYHVTLIPYPDAELFNNNTSVSKMNTILDSIVINFDNYSPCIKMNNVQLLFRIKNIDKLCRKSINTYEIYTKTKEKIKESLKVNIDILYKLILDYINIKCYNILLLLIDDDCFSGISIIVGKELILEAFHMLKNDNSNLFHDVSLTCVPVVLDNYDLLNGIIENTISLNDDSIHNNPKYDIPTSNIMYHSTF